MLYRIFLLCLFLLGNIYSQEQKSELADKINNLYKDEFFNSTLMAVDVYDLSANKSLYKKNEKMLLKPASNMKILTTSAGLKFLGPDYKFTTSVYYTGQIVNKTLYGDLYFVGGADPDFTTADLDTLISFIKSTGISEVTGNLYGDISMLDSLFWGNGWMWDDDPSTDAPYLTPLTINNNAIGVAVKAADVGKPADVEIIPNTDFVKVLNETETVQAVQNNYYKVDRDWLNRNNLIIVEGNISSADTIPDTSYVNVFRPELYFLSLAEEEFAKSGIKIDGDKIFKTLPKNAVHLSSFERRFDSVIVNLNKTSDNLSAELTLRALAVKNKGIPATAQHGIQLVDSLLILAGLNPSDYRIVDGSGVSHYNLITNEVLLSVLNYMYYYNRELFTILYHSFPVAGVDGTLKFRMKNTPSENNVHAKTGTLSGVSSLSGYVTAKNGDLLSFSILVQNYVGSSITARNYQNKICEILAGYE